MTRFGYTLMTEQSGPKELVRYAQGAEEVGFDFAVSSDHYSPWLASQGHAPYAWSVLGAVAHVTERMDLMTYVTCPILRYHPAVVAQKAATLGVLSDGRFTLGLGAGENLNEHVVGEGWPSVDARQGMLAEALEIIRALHTGEVTTYDGEYFRVDSAHVWDLPEGGVPLAVAVSGEKSINRLGPLADHMISTEPMPDLVQGWDAMRTASSLPSGAQTRKIGQVPICWGPDAEEATRLAHEQFRWFAGGWAVNADLPTPLGFAGATQFVRPEDVAQAIPCGPDVDAVVEGVKPFWEAGYSDIALVQVGDARQQEFLDGPAAEILTALREAAPTG